MEKGLQSQKEYEALDRILMSISRHMLDHQLSVISVGEVQQIFRDYLKERNLGVEPSALFSIMKERCDIAVVDEARGVFMFKHRTFAEYFYAKSLMRTPSVSLTAKSFEPYWMHSFFFYVGLLRDCAEIIEQIPNIPDLKTSHRWLRAMHAGEFLLAAYASPYASVSKVLREVMLDAARLYREICSGEVESPLANLTRIHLFWFFQYMIREGYGYEFLKNAIESTAIELKVDDSLDRADVAYALFFLNAAYVDVSEGETFDFMLRDWKGSLPLEVELAIGYEGERMGLWGKLMKKQDKQLHRALAGNRLLADKIRDLHDKPINPATDKSK